MGAASRCLALAGRRRRRTRALTSRNGSAQADGAAQGGPPTPRHTATRVDGAPDPAEIPRFLEPLIAAPPQEAVLAITWCKPEERCSAVLRGVSIRDGSDWRRIGFHRVDVPQRLGWDASNDAARLRDSHAMIATAPPRASVVHRSPARKASASGCFAPQRGA
jgi:hypothetical protein